MPNLNGRRDLRGELARDDGTYPPSWRPNPGAIISGTLIRYSSATTAYGRATIAVIEDEASGERISVWLIHTVLKNEFQKQRPEPGERLAIKYFGVVDAANYHRYKLLVDRPDEVPDFGSSATTDELPGDFALSKPPSSEADHGADEDVPF